MMTPDPDRDGAELNAIRQLLAAARPQQIARLLADIRDCERDPRETHRGGTA